MRNEGKMERAKKEERSELIADGDEEERETKPKNQVAVDSIPIYSMYSRVRTVRTLYYGGI